MPTTTAHQSRHLALDTFTSFGALLLFLRRRAQLRQRELAQAVGYSESHIGRLENDQRLPDVAAVMAQFVPALDLEYEPELADRLIELARAAHGGLPDDAPERTAAPLVEDVKDTDAADEAEAPLPRSNVPEPPTPFLSRAAELVEIDRLLNSDGQRCVTLLGPGGVGKTRLAIEAARRNAPQFSDGAYVVPLAGVVSADLLLPTIAQALNLASPRDGDVLAQLRNYLGRRRVLLVLDNMEHLVDGADLVADLLGSAPGLHILSTSRERLQLRGEVVLEVDGFAVPSSANVPVEHLVHNDAVALYLSTARRIRHDFAPSDEDWPAIATICRLSEGFPLAIELAASWVRMLSCAEVAHELEQTWDLLHTSIRDLPARHRSMRVAFNHSWVLLTPAEQRTLRGLSVFRGSFTREAAAAALGVSPGAVLPTLTSLADKSMVKRATTFRSSRYVLHEVVRQYAAEQLQACPDEAYVVSARHSQYYLDLLCAREAAIRGTGQHQVLVEMSVDIDNLRAALDWAVLQADVRALRRALPVLLVLIEWRYSVAEGVAVFGHIAAGVRNTEPETHTSEHRSTLVLALAYAGWCLLYLGRSREALTHLHEAHALLGDSDDHLARGDTLLFLGYAVGNTGDSATGRRMLIASLRAFEACGDPWRTARGLYRLGMLMHQDGAYVRAQHLFQACLLRLATIGDPRATALTLNRLGIMEALLGRPVEAQARIQESLLHSSAAHDQRGIASALFHMGSLAQQRGDHAAASYLFVESLDLFTVLNERASMADALAQIGYSAVCEQDLQAAQRAFDEAWQIVGQSEVNTTALSLLVSCAARDLMLGHSERAVEALTLTLHHAVSEQGSRDRAAQLLHQAEARLTPYQFVTAQQRGRAASFAEYVP